MENQTNNHSDEVFYACGYRGEYGPVGIVLLFEEGYQALLNHQRSS